MLIDAGKKEEKEEKEEKGLGRKKIKKEDSKIRKEK